MKILVIIPTYNERENMPRLLGRLQNVDPNIEVLVVDDNSPDGTGELVEGFTKDYPRIHLLKRAKKSGLGPAYIAGFKWALERDYDCVIQMDGDLSHRPRYIPKYLELIKTHDMVIGSRWIPGGRICNWPFRRVLLSRIANFYSQSILQVPIHDLTGGFLIARRNVLESMDFDTIKSDGYSFQIEIKFRTFINKFRVCETPITFTDRTAGDSKISRRIVMEALFMVWYLTFKRKSLIGQRPELASV